MVKDLIRSKVTITGKGLIAVGKEKMHDNTSKGLGEVTQTIHNYTNEQVPVTQWQLCLGGSLKQ
jgi:hypothetical protein